LHTLHWSAAVGVTLVVAPEVQNFAIKPYFWILIVVGLFDGGIYLLGRIPRSNADDECAACRLRDRDRFDGGDPGAGWCAGSIFLAPLSISQFEYPVAAAGTAFGRGDAIARHIPPEHIGAMPA
jgi:hypothetical protein